ncbi:MAG: PilT/PilU family type 4a pilus ATPase [Deltaproteobacteria bacterium]|nr:PilT/PilU family type 4a pilus ATPase [Deltaproteobacteria bacterium]
MPRLDSFLRVVVEQSASDLHFSSGAVPYIRRDGALEPLPFRCLSEVETRRFLFEILTTEQLDRLQEEQTLDFVHGIEGVGRFRGNIFMHATGIGSVFRIIPDAAPSITQLGLPQAAADLVTQQSGLILVCGPTGAGKTTTAAAMLDVLNQNTRRHIITIEDPIEFLHTSKESVISQRQIGEHAQGYADAVKAALRESPDVLLVGELRESDTVMLALTAADQGVLVFGTLHASSSAQALLRILDLFPEARRQEVQQLLGAHLQGIIAQRLLRCASGEGRTPNVELLLRTPAVTQLIRDGKAHQIEALLHSQEMRDLGMCSFQHALAKLVSTGVVALEDACATAEDPDALAEEIHDLASKAAA